MKIHICHFFRAYPRHNLCVKMKIENSSKSLEQIILHKSLIFFSQLNFQGIEPF